MDRIIKEDETVWSIVEGYEMALNDKLTEIEHLKITNFEIQRKAHDTEETLRQQLFALENMAVEERMEKEIAIERITEKINAYQSRLYLYERATKLDHSKIVNLITENNALKDRLENLINDKFNIKVFDLKEDKEIP